MGTLKVNGAISATANSNVGNLNFTTSGSISTVLNTTSGWARGWSYKINDIGVGGFGMFGSAETVKHFYFGAYDAAWCKIEPDGTVTATKFKGALSGNASTASKWATARTLTLTGSVTGSVSIDGSGNVSLATTTNHTHSYIPLSGATLSASAVIKFPASAGTIAASDPMAITYGRISAYGTLCINANTDNSGTEYVILTAGKGLSSSTSDGLAIGTSTLTWQGANVITSSNYSSYITNVTQWKVTSTNPSTTSTDSNLQAYNAPNSRLYWVTQTGVVNNQPSQWGYIMDIGDGSERHQLWIEQPHGSISHRGGNASGWGGAWKKILDSSNYTSYCAPASHTHSYLPLSGGTISGLLNISANGNTTTIGSQNSSWCHIYNNTDARFIFNKDVVTIGAFAIYQCDSRGCGSSFPGSPILGQIFYKI